MEELHVTNANQETSQESGNAEPSKSVDTMPKTSSSPIPKMVAETLTTSKPTEPSVTKKTRKEKRLSKKEAGFIKDYVKTGNGVQSALKNYDTEDYATANAIARENLQKPRIINRILSIAEQIPDKLLAERHLELLNKREHIKIEDEIEDVGPDTQAVSKALDMAYKLKGAYAPEKNLNLNINQSSNDPRIQEIADKVEEELKKKHEQTNP